MTDKCPYCSDYDDLKEELENTRKDAERETKDSLSKCESEKNKLQKQLLGIGIAVIVAGTILGQEFIDKVGSYIESFNSVKNVTTGVVSQSDAPSVLPPFKSDTPKTQEKQKKKPNNTLVRHSGLLLPNVALSSLYTAPFEYDLFNFEYYDSYSVDLSAVLDVPIIQSSFDFEPFTTTFDQNSFEFTDPFFYNQGSEPYENFIARASTPVPGPGVLIMFALGIIILKKPTNRERR